MESVKYTPHPSGIEEIGRSSKLQAACVDSARDMVPRLLSAAPKSHRSRQAGEQGYGASLQVIPTTSRSGRGGGKRVAAMVVSKREYTPLIGRGAQNLAPAIIALRKGNIASARQGGPSALA